MRNLTHLLALCAKKEGGLGYRCKKCKFGGHKECIERSLTQASHCQHPLRLYATSPPGSIHPRCYFCQERYETGILRHCLLCDITVDLKCLRDPPPFTIYHQKNHKHELKLLAREVSFTCNACGMEGQRNPYVCFECSLMFHKDCIYLPRIISINRHDHRISNTSQLPYNIWKCGVCRQSISFAYGAFTCKRCPNYAVHSKCATNKEVWDGKELEDEPPEEEIEDPFEVINETDVIHFSHKEHTLRLENNYANMRCDGCVLPIMDDPFYKCVSCSFCLHETCANLPRKKRHFLHNQKLTLVVDNNEAFKCSACWDITNGFRYHCRETSSDDGSIFDIRCSSIKEPFHVELHPHPLYRTWSNDALCRGCSKLSHFKLNCIVCTYSLGMKCATLPRKVKHRCDDHFLSLCQGAGNSNGDCWCDICETKTDLTVWYYTCDICGVTLHVNCVLGDLYYLKQGYVHLAALPYFIPNDSAAEIVPNNGASRPLCTHCKTRCRFPFFLKYTVKESATYCCSFDCYIN